MDSMSNIRSIVKQEILSNCVDTKQQMLNVIGNDVDEFINVFSDELNECKKLDSFFAQDIKGSFITIYVYSSMNNC